MEKFDPKNEGFIDIEQFRNVMRSLGEPLLDDEIDDLIQLGLNDEHRKIDIECKNSSLKFSFLLFLFLF